MKNKGLNISDGNAEKIGAVLTAMIEACSKDWQKPWISVNGATEARAYEGKAYNGMNAFLLGMLTQVKGYKTGYYLTMPHLAKLGLTLKHTTNEDGKKEFEKPFPVIFWKRSFKSGEKWINDNEYEVLTESEKEECKIAWVCKTYNVFNLDQTNYAEVFPEKWAKMIIGSDVQTLVCEQDYTNAVLDYEIESEGGWRCPIKQTEDGEAYYRISTDAITLPMRNTFKNNSSFYGTALHEMTHSTGKELKREMEFSFGTNGYAKEELVAELTAAILMNDFGCEKYVKEDSIPYAKSWCKILKDKDAVKGVMDDVMRAVSYHKKMYASAEHAIANK